jgi:P-type Ca2+ transporter type 2C
VDEILRLWHALSAEQTVESLSSNAVKGLSSAEARRRVGEYGSNSIKQERKTSVFRIFLGQFKNVLIIILLFAISISALLGDLVDSIVIGLIVVLVAITGFVQEYRAEKVFESLKRRLSQSCTAVRDNRRQLIPTADLVPGDIVLLESGTRVPADIRLIQVAALQVDESSLTGESVPVTKSVAPIPEDSAIEERANIAFAGTTVTYGRSVGVVVATGGLTEFGKIVKETLDVQEEETPLQRQVASIGKNFGVLALIVISMVGFSEVLRGVLAGNLSLSGLVGILLFGIALGVAAVPEALPAIVTATLAIGMRILAKNNALVRKMSAVETLGSTEVICFDKTGTLTKGEMTVRELYADETTFQVSGAGYAPDGSISLDGRRLETMPASLLELALASLLCNDAILQESADGEWQLIGDPTEGALIVLAKKIAPDISLRKPLRVTEIPFSSERKLMTTIHRLEGARVMGYMKGAPGSVLLRCNAGFAGSRVMKLNEADRKGISRAYEELSGRGLRVLALASKEFELEPTSWDADIEDDFVFLGLVAMEDPLRDSARETIQRARDAGIKPVMITGDHKTTAVAIAKQAGIFRPGDGVLTGKELQEISDSELAERVQQTTVYARISPLDKLKIVSAWRNVGRVVAMTGDGVNDAPALKRADIGVAMGISGTDVAKEAADIILTDDDFASMVRAVELGRWIYDNIKKSLAYLLQTNLVEIAVLGLIALLIGPLMGLPEGVLPLLPVQILYTNLATDGLPALALGFSPIDSDLLRKPPRPRGESVLTKDLLLFLVSTLLVQVPVLLLAFVTGVAAGVDVARTRLFLMLIFMELAVAINCRSLSQGVLKAKPHRLLIASVLWETLLIMVLLWIPQTRDALHLLIPRPQDGLWIVGGFLFAFGSGEAFKHLGPKSR